MDTLYADWTGLVSVRFLFGAMQDAASEHGDRLGHGCEFVQDQEILWVLAPMQLRMRLYPVRNHDMKLETWLAAKRLLFHRDFRFLSCDGAVRGQGTTAWAAFDVAERRPL